MKIVKLNRNFKINKYHGFEVAVKFDQWDSRAHHFEKVVADRLGNQSWGWKWHPEKKVKENWAGAFGERKKGEAAPYWIYFRRESMLSLVLLSIDHQKDQK